MELLIVGQADSIFFEHYSKNLKIQNPNINIDIYSIDVIKGNYDLSSCNIIEFNKWEYSIFSKIRGIRVLINPLYTWISFYLFLRKNKKHYDIIHFKWLVPSIILFPGIILKYCRKSVATFWGGELKRQMLFYSQKLYILFLKKFLTKIDAVTYIGEEQYAEMIELGVKRSKLYYAIYGSTIYNEIEKLIKKESKSASKRKMNLDTRRITLAIGYSGKEIHQHIHIINALFNYPKFVDNMNKYTFIFQMNRGCRFEYIRNIQSLLNYHGASYLLIRNKFTDTEIARLRNATDIMIQLSIADGRSSSIIEAILTGSILIAGNWLPYDELKSKNIYFFELSSVDYSLPELILRITTNINEELEQCKSNRDKWDLETWDKVIRNWTNVYNELMSRDNM